MHIRPDEKEAIRDQKALANVLRKVLQKAIVDLDINEEPVSALLADGAPNMTALASELLSYPGFVAAGFEAQSAMAKPCQPGRMVPLLQSVWAQALASARRSREGICPAWTVDLAPPEPHLAASLQRAMTQMPKKEKQSDPIEVAIADWREEERTLFCAACCRLASVWPEMLTEMATVVRQIALIRGYGIDGFTDFRTHGVIFVNERRLKLGTDGLPAETHLLEALVHEATHTRCNAARLSSPFLTSGERRIDQNSAPFVMTPLRADPRPLAGLFQQLVVLARSLVLYDRLLEFAGAVKAVQARRERLLQQTGQALEIARRHADRLSDHGFDIVGEVEELLNQRKCNAFTR